jgi:hypothetical protein
MSHCHDRNHAQVPQTLVALTISYCHQCFAWRVIATAHTAHADDELTDVMSIERDFGPFDDVALVLDEGELLLEKWMLRRGRPWDLQPELARDLERPAKSWAPVDPDRPA